jgi:DNA-binding NarL/FixJ family response regulator
MDHNWRVAGLRVVLADDHRLTASALSGSLVGHGVDVVAVAHTASDALREVKRKTPDVLVTDLDMGPGPNGIDLALRVVRALPTTGVVLLTAYEDPKLLSPRIPKLPPQVVYVVKQRITEVTDLLDAITTAHLYATGKRRPPKNAGQFVLNESQAALLRLIAQGLSNQAIADELKLTVGSVATSINRLAKKFGVTASDARNVRASLTQKYYDYVGFQTKH